MARLYDLVEHGHAFATRLTAAGVGKEVARCMVNHGYDVSEHGVDVEYRIRRSSGAEMDDDDIRAIRKAVRARAPDVECDGSAVEFHVDQNEPPCVDRDTVHEWKEEIGPFGIGGAAIIYKDWCVHCGTRRDSISGDVNTPSRNGVSYERNALDDEELAALRERCGFEQETDGDR